METSNTNLPDPLEREFADAWIPVPGDMLKRSSVLYTSERTNEYNNTYPIVTVRVGAGSTENGREPIPEGAERAVHCNRAGLRYGFADLGGVNPGDVIGVRYFGWFPKGEKRDGRLGPDQVPAGRSSSDGKFRDLVRRYGDDTVDWRKYGAGAEEPEHGTAVHRPLDDEALAETEAALAAERDELDALASGGSQ